MLAAAVFLALVGCNNSNVKPPTLVTTLRADGSTRNPGRPVYPEVDRQERAALAEDGLVRPASPQLRMACAKAAARTDWTVLCPTVTPGGRLAISAVSGVRGQSDDISAGYEISINSSALRAQGAPDPGHWTIAAGTPNAMQDQLSAYGRSKPVSHRRMRITGVTVTRYREPDYGDFPGVYGGHIVYQWTQGGAVLQVSIHGDVHERVLRGLVRLLSQGPDPSPDG